MESMEASTSSLPFTPLKPEEIKEYKVYIVVHRESGKMYVGITRATMKARNNQRMNGTKGYQATRIGKAFIEYGADAFDSYVVASGLTQREAVAQEQHYIEKLDTMNPEKGFNATRGGFGHAAPCRPEIKEKLRAVALERFSRNKSRGTTHNGRSVLQLSMDGELIATHRTSHDAAHAVGKNFPSMIVQCCNGITPQAHGFIWKYTENNRRRMVCGRKMKPVVACDVNGNEVKYYPSIVHAAAGIGVYPSLIGRCARGLQKTAGGYYWKFAELQMV